MQLPIIQIDAFTDKLFQGNPAAIIPLEEWLPDKTLCAIALENNLSETAYFIPHDNKPHTYNLRWFTPGSEVDLCGHATLATAHYLFTENPSTNALSFLTRSGELLVENSGNGSLRMNFPALPSSLHPNSEQLAERLEKIAGVRPQEFYSSTYAIARFETEDEIRRFTYSSAIEDFLADIDYFGLNITAPGNPENGTGSAFDFVSRFFAPSKGVPEDPVTGSAHCGLAPLWAERLNKTKLKAAQLSPRGGIVECNVSADRIFLTGKCVTYMNGVINI